MEAVKVLRAGDKDTVFKIWLEGQHYALKVVRLYVVKVFPSISFRDFYIVTQFDSDVRSATG